MTTRLPGETRDPMPGLEATLAKAMTGSAGMDALLTEFASAPIILPSTTSAEQGFEPLIFAPEGSPFMAVFTARDRAAIFADQAPYSVVMLGRRVFEGLQPGVGLVVNPGSGLGFEMQADGVRSALGAIGAAGDLPDPNVVLEQAILDARDGLIPAEALLETFLAGKVYVLSHSADELAPFTFLSEGSPNLVGVFTRPEFAQPFTDGVEHAMFVDVDYLVNSMVDGFGIVVNPGGATPWALEPEAVQSLKKEES